MYVCTISCSLWEVIEPEEAADICSQVSEPGSAAKHLLDLAQAYGSRQAVSVIVVQLRPPTDVYEDSPQSVHEECPISSMVQKRASDLDRYKEYPEKAQHKVKDVNGVSQRVKFSTLNLLDSKKQCYTSKSRKDCRESFLCSGVNRIKISGDDDHSVMHSIGDLERSSPSGQSQSDGSEYSPDTDKEARITFKEFSDKKPRDIFQPLNGNSCAHSRRKSRSGKKIVGGSQVISNGYCNEEKTVTYYHYPRPESGAVPPQGNMQHLHTEPQTSVLAPPAGFGDPGSDSEGSDSGLSGVSGIQSYADHPSGANLENTIGDNGDEQVRPYATSHLVS